MPPIIKFDIDYDPDTCWGLDEFKADGVLSGFVTLRIRNKKILDYYPRGMNNSIVALLRSCFQDHIGADPQIPKSDFKKWPLFYCDGNLDNDCGVINDFSVTHSKNKVTLSNFYKCDCPSSTIISLPWTSWSAAIEKQATRVLRKCPPVKKDVSAENHPKYQSLRNELLYLLRELRKGIKKGQRPDISITSGS